QGDAGRLALCLGNELNSGGKTFGAFKSGCMRAYGALLRLLWAAFYQPASPYDFPAPLLGSKPPPQYFFERDQNNSPDGLELWLERVGKFLAGDSDELIHALAPLLPCGENVSAFQRSLHLSDLEILADFFERGPRRNHELRKQYDISAGIIRQEELDDLLAMSSKESKNPGTAAAAPASGV
ncbi:MAG TPA: hypothetical protein VFC07_03195, partial [Verrucomicrobiae bacterium]|nr:hypothetical protein [Verrucomicrobiae bacterium]